MQFLFLKKLGSSDSKESACSAGDPGLIPGLGRSSEEENGNLRQYFFLENSMDRGAWQATFLGVSKHQTQLSILDQLHVKVVSELYFKGW